ncbi:MAG: DNA topoisomerase IV subunit A [archaeon]
MTSRTMTSAEMQKERQENASNKIKELGKKIIAQMNAGEPPEIELPIRGASNAIYDPKKKMIFPGDKKTKRKYMNVGHTRKFMQTVMVADACKKELLDKSKTGTIRDLYYNILRTLPGTKIQTVDNQTESNEASVDLEVALGLMREDLNLKADKKGSIVGNVIIEDSGDEIDWSKLGSGGWAIPSITEDIQFKKVKADFILYVEKNAIWERLNEDKVWKKLNCILIATQGQATRGARRLINRMSNELDLPVYVFTDADPYGWYIYSVIKYGSMALAHTSSKLSTPNAKFVGMTIEDIAEHGLEKHTIKLKPQDIKRAKEMMSYPWFQSKEWQRELKLAVEKGYKAELEALSKHGIEYISERYIPQKLKKKEFLD